MMCQHVGMQVGLLVKALMTALEVAEEGFLSSVDAQMCLQIEIQGKLLATEVALVRFLSLYTMPVVVVNPCKLQAIQIKHL